MFFFPLVFVIRRNVTGGHRLDPAETLVIVVSKTFTTAETMLNARTMKDWLLTSMKGKANAADIISQHMVR